MVFNGGVSVTQLVALPLNADGQVELLSPFASVDVTIDVVGWNVAATDTWAYGYNPDGLRASKTPPAGTGIGATTFTWNRASGLPMLLAQTQAGIGVTYFVYGPGGLPVEQINPDGTTLWLHHDQIGSTRTATDATGAAVATWSYDPYGNQAAHTGTIDVPLGYTGQYTDRETGYQYLRARYYDPPTATFLTRDPAVSMTRDAYGYVYGDPLNRVDPSGLAPWDGICIRGVNCPVETQSFREDHPEVAQGIVDFSSGMLSFNPITAATNAAGWTDTDQKANTCSGWYRGGQATMLAIDLAAGGGLARNTRTTVEGPATAWGTRGTQLDLAPGRWVVPGGRTPGNYFKTTTWSNLPPASYGNSITGTVRYAWDGGVSGFLRGMLGHRVVVP
jgi:RHS repeat-associated protein